MDMHQANSSRLHHKARDSFEEQTMNRDIAFSADYFGMRVEFGSYNKNIKLCLRGKII